MPLVESSITIHVSRLKPEAIAAFIKISGCGFDAFKSAPLSLAIKYWSRLKRLKILLILGIEAEEANTKANPFL